MTFGKSTNRFAVVALAIAALLFVKPAMADVFYFSFSGTTVAGSGMLNATANGDGSFTAVDGTGTQTVSGVADTLTLIFNPNGTTVFNSPSGVFYDNQLFPDNAPLISEAGLLFATSAQDVNLFSNLSDAGYHYGNPDGFDELITFALSDTPFQTVPEPESTILFCIGLIGFAAARRRSQ